MEGLRTIVCASIDILNRLEYADPRIRKNLRILASSEIKGPIHHGAVERFFEANFLELRPVQDERVK